MDDPSQLVEALGSLDLFERARVTLADGTVIEGRVQPITYSPNRFLRLEIRPRLGDDRFELQAEFADGRWTTPVASRCGTGDDSWTEIGELTGVQPTDNPAAVGTGHWPYHELQ